MSSIFKKNYPQGKYELAGAIVAQLIPAIYQRDPNDYMTGDTWWDYGPNYVKWNYQDDWMETYLQKYEEVETYLPESSFRDDWEEDSE